MSDLKISVIMSTYNRFDLFKIAFNSVYMQIGNNEIVVVNDGSNKEQTEKYNNWYEKFEDKGHVKYINGGHYGLPYQTNRGIEKSNGELICTLNDDDMMLPGSLAERKEVFIKNPNTEVIYTSYCDINIYGGILKRVHVESPDKDRIMKEDYINNQSMMWRRSVHDKIGYFNENLIQAEDLEWKIKCLFECNVMACDCYTVATRRHSQQKSILYRSENNKYCEAIWQRMKEKYNWTSPV